MADKVLVSLLERYQQYLDQKCERHAERYGGATQVSCVRAHTGCDSLSVGVIGGGIAGLYSALLLQNYVPGVKVKLFEASNRVGGRIYTYKFSSDPHQYFEAGAMRIPTGNNQASVFQLIDYLNKIKKGSLEVVDYHNACPSGNRVLVNDTKQRDGRVMTLDYASKHCSELGFACVENNSQSADKLLQEALAPAIQELNVCFSEAIEKYKNMSLYTYLLQNAGWNVQKINYVETMTSQTNTFQFDFINSALHHEIYQKTEEWKTIEGGMSKLAESCAQVVRRKGDVLLNSKVESLTHTSQGLVQVGYTNSIRGSLTCETFDAAIMAIPPSCIRTMPEKPQWSADLNYALRAIGNAHVSKIGLRFKSRFWEHSNLQHPPSFGGQSITDLTSRRFLYPSHGIGEEGPGVLFAYSWASDAEHWVPKSRVEKIQFFLRDLQQLYPEIDIAGEYAGGSDPSTQEYLDASFVIEWFQHSLGVQNGPPGQFEDLYPILSQPQGNVFSAGSHLSPYNIWISGALASARKAVQQMLTGTDMHSITVDYLK